MRRFLCLFLFFLWGNLRGEEPWSISFQDPVIEEPTFREKKEGEKGFSSFLFDKDFISILFDIYKEYFSPLDGSVCVFEPTCSLYTKEAIRRYGMAKGILMWLDRLLRCHPAQKERWDPPIDY